MKHHQRYHGDPASGPTNKNAHKMIGPHYIGHRKKPEAKALAKVARLITITPSFPSCSSIFSCGDLLFG